MAMAVEKKITHVHKNNKSETIKKKYTAHTHTRRSLGLLTPGVCKAQTSNICESFPSARVKL